MRQFAAEVEPCRLFGHVNGARAFLLRTVEWILGLYFCYTGVLATALTLSSEVRMRTLLVNLLVLALLATLAVPHRWRDRRWAQLTRDHYALALVLLAYKQMGWFAPLTHDYTLEHRWIAGDYLVLGKWGLKQAIESLGPTLPTLLELSYLLVYAVGPFCVWFLYGLKREKQVPSFLLVYILGLFLSYAQFPFWPSEPPRTVFPGNFEPLTSVMRRLNLAVVGNAGIHTSVFPSAHVSGCFAAAFAFWRLLYDKPWIRYALVIYAVLVAVATVYGRYHYAVDAVAGFVVAIAAYGMSYWLLRRERPEVTPTLLSEQEQSPAT